MDTVVSVDHPTPEQPTHDHPAAQATQTVSIDQAAILLGLSVTTIRRRIRKGGLPAEKIDGPHGPEYRVHLEQGQRATVVAEPTQGQATRVPTHDQGADHGHLSTLVAVVDRLTADNAKLQDERSQLFGRLGFLEAELRQAREQIRQLTAPAPDAVPDVGTMAPATTPDRWAWWRFWRRLASTVV